MKKYSLKVCNINKETSDTITLCFKQPGLKKIKYQAGQYLTLSARINGRKYSRPYSFSSAPSCNSNLEITIKRVPGGVFSNYIHDFIQIDDIIEVMEPMGDFVYEQDENCNEIYFWGTGSGITPLISIIKEILISESKLKVNLIYGNKNFESTIFSELIEEMINKYPKNLQVWYLHSQYKEDQNHHLVKSGRISREFVYDLLENIDLKTTKHYICGPNGLKDTIKETLSVLKCPEDNIFSEDFELVKNPKDFEDIKDHTVDVCYQGVNTFVNVGKGKSILEAALDLGLELPYSCQTGSCNTCKCTLMTGELRMIGLSKERNDLRKEEYLLCCSYPLTDNVSVEI
ncbi:flavin reductase family protein [Flavobacterium panacagri]|uniref:flavin reductase family protein n=1 Tax=Flavobacterium panacagri TaxID=3034146 RepID=UPI0025A4DD93|nr:iron-sulfur cluster-binding domain-containing protein [Flavobacterium panacagri]